MHWTNNGLVVHAPGNRKGLTLNAAAAMIWQLCDGSRSLQEMDEEIKSSEIKNTGDLDNGLSDTIKHLFKLQLVDLQSARVRPVLRLGFIGFAEEFDRDDNFLINLLSEWVDILRVETDEEADILVVNGKAERHHKKFSAALLVLLDDGDEPCDTSGFDLIFTIADVQTHSSNMIPLPEDYLSNRSAEIAYAYKENISEFFVTETEANGEAFSIESVPKKKLTIGMATYDDYDGAYFTVQAIRMFHPEVTNETEILIIDNNPSGACASHLQDLASDVESCRYIANDSIQGTAVRDFVFHEADTDYVMCIDSHVLIEPGAIRKLIDYFDTNPDTPDLLQGPLIRDDMKTTSTYFIPVWNKGMFGVWSIDKERLDPNGEVFDIPMQGLGLAACRKSAWQGYNPRFRGFGGEEGYIHQKFRNAGARTLCLPSLRWLHRFGRPLGVPYENVWEDRIRNYLIGFEEVGLDTEEVCSHFRDHVNTQVVDLVLEQLANEDDNPFDFFDAIYCINLKNQIARWRSMQVRLRRLGILHRVRRFDAIETPESHHIGCTLTHRRIIEEANNKGYSNVLVLEDDALFHKDTLNYLRQSIKELENQQWNVFYLGGMKWGKRFNKLPQCQHLERPQGMTCTHAVAYRSPFYDKLLNDLPADIANMKKWIESNAAIDQYLAKQEELVVISPVVASQPNILNEEEKDLLKNYR